jgi:hypothetical protein
MSSMTYYIAISYSRLEDGTLVAGEAREVHTSMDAVALARHLAAEKVGAVAFSRTGDPATTGATNALVIATFGEVPENLSEL